MIDEVCMVRKTACAAILSGAYFARQGVLLYTGLHCLWSLPCLGSASVIPVRRLPTGRLTPLQLRRAAVHTSACAISTRIQQLTTRVARPNTFARSTTRKKSIRDITATSISQAPRYG